MVEKDIGKINKNDQTDIVLRIDDFGGKPGVTIREFVTSDRYTGFTKAGVRIQVADFPKFKEMVNSISEQELQEMSQQAQSSGQSSEENKSDNSNADKKPASGQEQLPDY
ncbi:MAG: hypothetical protein ACOCUU_02570 [Nanoarchaeota archaeon]